MKNKSNYDISSRVLKMFFFFKSLRVKGKFALFQTAQSHITYTWGTVHSDLYVKKNMVSA